MSRAATKTVDLILAPLHVVAVARDVREHEQHADDREPARDERVPKPVPGKRESHLCPLLV